MKKSEIASIVFQKLDSKPLQNISDGPLEVSISELGGLALVPWFCDGYVQWAFRISQPGVSLKKNLLKKVNDSFINEKDGAILIGVPGDGIEPSTFTLFPLAEAVAAVVKPGMILELAAANLGIVKRDWEVKAETISEFGDQHYFGTINDNEIWQIIQSTPLLTRTQLETALACGRMVAKNGPWKTQDRNEAASILMHWMQSPDANINPMAVKRFIQFKDGEFLNTDPDMERKLCGLGLGFFRQRLANGSFQWSSGGPLRHPEQTYQEVITSVFA